MKKPKLLYLLLVMLLALAGCGEEEEEEKSIPVYGYVEDKSEYVLENEYLKLALDPETTQFSLEDKRTGKIWYSNPPDLSNETIANTSTMAALRSTLMITYGTKTGVATTYNNYAYSIENGLYEIEEIDGGLKVKYSVGNIERTYIMPTAVPESRMLEFYNNMDSKAKKRVDEYYRKYDINNLRATDDRAALLEAYPDLENECVYVLRDGLKEYLKVNLESYFEAAGYTYEDYEEDAARYESTNETSKPVFNVSVVYKLDGKDFLVSIPYEEVAYKADYPITSIKPLPYFGAGGPEDEGYILVPDGNGAIISFNNGKSTQSNYYGNVYGWDYGTTRTAVVNETKALYPLFGVCNGGTSFLCIMEEGSAMAVIEADVSGRYHTFNYANAAYTVIHGENMDVSSKSDKSVVVYEKEIPEGEILQRYRFVDSDSYSDMAVAYRDYLMGKYPELRKDAGADVPVTVELVGAIEKVENRFGFPVTVSKSLTSYKEAAEILEGLAAAGFSNMDVKYIGWFNDGIHHGVPTKVKLISELGSKKSFRQFVSKVNELGGRLYLEAYVEFINKNSLTDGFYANRDSAKFVTKELTEVYDFSPIWYGETKSGHQYLVKTTYTMKLVDAILKDIAKYDVKNISFADLGKMLGGDYNPKAVVNREATMKAQQQKLAELKANGNGVMVYDGNAFAAPYADTILNLDLNGNGYGITDYQVPFYSMALHGLVNYTGKAANLAEDYEANILKSIECGAGLYFTFTESPASVFQETDYTYLYAAEFGLWKDKAAALYQEYKKAMDGLYSQFITGHRYVADGVAETTYEDGTKVYVNYNYSDYSGNGINVAARSYTVKKGGE